MLHMVVRQIADDVPAYVIENEKGKQKVLIHVRLLLWSSAEEEEELQMTAAQLAFQVSMLVLAPLPVGDERSRVPYWEVLMLVDSVAAARVSGAAETVDYFG